MRPDLVIGTKYTAPAVRCNTAAITGPETEDLCKVSHTQFNVTGQSNQRLLPKSGLGGPSQGGHVGKEEMMIIAQKSIRSHQHGGGVSKERPVSRHALLLACGPWHEFTLR